MTTDRAIAYGILFALLLYNIYVHVFKRFSIYGSPTSPSVVRARNSKDFTCATLLDILHCDDGMQSNLLNLQISMEPNSFNAKDACSRLKLKYKIEDNLDELSRSVRHHWQSLQCASLLSKIPSDGSKTSAYNLHQPLTEISTPKIGKVSDIILILQNECDKGF
jgi:hypothetical protein